jgi:hypothetical protein
MSEAYADKFFAEARVEPAGYVRLTSADLASATGFSIANARVALITVIGANVRWRDDGTDPTAADGMPVFAGQSFKYCGNLKNLKFIREAAGAEVHISGYK